MDQLETPTIPRTLYDEANPDLVFLKEGTRQHNVIEEGCVEGNPAPHPTNEPQNLIIKPLIFYRGFHMGSYIHIG